MGAISNFYIFTIIMKKLFLVFIAVFSFIAQASAQSSMLATLNHEGNISTFYGTTALREAHAAAVHGDVITLSSGSFVSTDITKAITLRGAGMELDTIHGTEPTVISGDFKIGIEDSIEQRLTIEGVYSNHTVKYINLKNAIFLKNRFLDFTYDDYDTSLLQNVTFIHCRVAKQLYLNDNCSASCLNCIIAGPESKNYSSSNFEFQNCVLYLNLYYVKSSTYKNCVLCSNYSNSRVETTCMAYNCIGSNGTNLFENIPNATNTYVEDISTVYKTYTGQNLEKLDSENFELTDEAKTKYLGMDGTQVGIYGGSLPFTSVPTNPQITKCNVAAKSTADGKLSVDIEVKAAE